MKLLSLMLLLIVTAGAQTAPVTAPLAAPASVPAGAKVLLTLTGVGFQVYACQASATRPAWTLVAPQAKLVDEHGAEVGFHGKGPAWTLNHGGSVKGELVSAKPSPDATAIPWLLLKAVEAKGTLAQVRFIRRSETKGGRARATGCDRRHLEATDLVGYKATYTFYTLTP